MTNFIFRDVDDDKSSEAMHASPRGTGGGQPCVCASDKWGWFFAVGERRVGVATLRSPPFAVTKASRRPRRSRTTLAVPRETSRRIKVFSDGARKCAASLSLLPSPFVVLSVSFNESFIQYNYTAQLSDQTMMSEKLFDGMGKSWLKPETVKF